MFKKRAVGLSALAVVLFGVYLRFIYYLLRDVGDIMMMRKCMLGIKQRAERSDGQVHECIEASTHHQVRQDEPLA